MTDWAEKLEKKSNAIIIPLSQVASVPILINNIRSKKVSALDIEPNE